MWMKAKIIVGRYTIQFSKIPHRNYNYEKDLRKRSCNLDEEGHSCQEYLRCWGETPDSGS